MGSSASVLNMHRTYLNLFALILLVCCDIFEGCEIDLDERSGKFPPFILNDAGHPIYPINSRKLSFDDGAKIILFCHGTGNENPLWLRVHRLEFHVFEIW